MKARGLGYLFQMPGSRNWWVGYTDPITHKRIRESCGSPEKRVAKALLRKRIGAMAAGKAVGPDVDRTSLGDLAAGLTDDHRVNGLSIRAIKAPLDHLLNYFGAEFRALDITTDRINAFIIARQRTGAASSTINRSLAALKRCFTLAERAGKVARRPHVPMLKESNARSGFLSHAEFERLRAALPEDLRDLVGFLYFSGWRLNEMRTLEWRDVDRAAGVARLRPEVSKTDEARSLPLRGELSVIIERAAARRTPACAMVFHRAGRPVGEFRKSWITACRAAGLGAVLVHDLRRCAIRNMIRAGVPDKIAMEISGHRTRSIFDRYNIVDEADQARAMDRVGEYLAAQPGAASNVVPLKKAAD